MNRIENLNPLVQKVILFDTNRDKYFQKTRRRRPNRPNESPEFHWERLLSFVSNKRKVVQGGEGILNTRQPDIYIYGDDPDNEIELAVTRAQSVYSNLHFYTGSKLSQTPPVIVFVLDPCTLELGFRRYGTSKEYPFAPAISGYGLCAINSAYFTNELFTSREESSRT